MSYIITTLDNLIHQTAFFNLTGGNIIMIVVACVILYLAIAKGIEPLLQTPIAFGMLRLIFILTSWHQLVRMEHRAAYYIISIYLMNGQSYHP